MRLKYYVISLLTLSACTPQKWQDGLWRGELAVQDKQAPFLFEVKNANTDSTILTLINGKERVPLTGVTYSSGSVTIPVELYDAVIKAKISGDYLEGRLFKNYIDDDKGIPFRARRGDFPRFEAAANPDSISIDGKWDILFINEHNDTSRNVGIFASDNQIVEGSILTSGGDLRFLEGIVTDSGVTLSAFSGVNPYLIDLHFLDENTFEGEFYTPRSTTKLTGRRNDKAALDDAYSLTRLKAGTDRIDFKLPATEGKIVSLDDDRYKNKVVVVSILGTWCPNCLDEAKYLSPWYDENKDRGVEIVGLAFERKNDFEYAQTTVGRLKKKYDIHYEIVFAGQANPETVARVLPGIENFSSYPTTIFIDKKGKVRKIHTGFSGPATGLFYHEYQTEFNNLINSLLSE